MKLQHIILYTLAAVTLATAIIYFILAYNEYISLIEFAAEGLDGEISELQIEIALFAGSGIIYLGLLGWILVKKLKSIIPYSILIVISTILIITICCIPNHRGSNYRYRILYWKIRYANKSITRNYNCNIWISNI